MTVTAEDGEEATSEETAPVTNDMSAEIKLIDENGLQTDGTALPTDNLVVSYGADLGTPSIIIWYCNGAAKTVYSLSGGGITAGAFESDGLRLATLPEGDWWVTIENTAGDVSVTNVITVASEDIAVMSAVSFEDDYETPDQAEIDDDVTATILNVTFNKNYAGELYIIEAKYSDGYGGAASIANTVDMTTATFSPTNFGPKAVLKKVSKATQLTNKAASAAVASGLFNGAYFEDSDGAIHCKFAVSLDGTETVKRGTDYYLVFDQEDIEGDNITTTGVTKDDLNTSESATVPYLNGPEAVEVLSFSDTAGVLQVNLFDENGDVLSWMGDTAIATAAGAGFDDIKVFGTDENKIDAEATGAAPTVSISKGVATLTNAGELNGNDFAYAKFTTTAGIFGAESETLTTNIGEAAIAPMAKMVLKEDGDDATAAKVTFSGLKTAADGTLYIIQGNSTKGVNLDELVNTIGVAKAVKSVEIEGGTGSVVIPGVFNKSQLGAADYTDNFVAVFVPENEDLFKSFYSGSESTAAFVGDDNIAGGTTAEVFTLTEKVASYKLSGTTKFSTVHNTTTAGLTVDAETITQTLVGVNQFGDDINPTVTPLTALATEVAGLEFSAATSSTTDVGAPTITIDNVGAIAIADFDENVAVDKNDKWTCTTSFGTFTLGVNTAGTTALSDAAATATDDGTEVFVLTYANN